MATKQANSETTADLNTALSTDLSTEVLATPDTPTPENTPKPGGGSWHWDAAVPGWVENTYA